MLRSLKARSHIPVIMMTAAPSEADRRASLEAGAAAYLAKPVDPDDLYERVCKARRRRSCAFTHSSRSHASASRPLHGRRLASRCRQHHPGDTSPGGDLALLPCAADRNARRR